MSNFIAGFVKKAIVEQQQLLCHCNGDAAAQQFIDAYETVDKRLETAENFRPVLIHGQLATPDQMSQLKLLGMIVSFFVAHTWQWGDIHIENFGYKRTKNISPVKTAIKNSIPYTFHQDSPVLMPNMIDTIKCAMHRKTKKGVLLNQEECVSLEEALKAITINGAYQYYEEDTKGSIRIGKKADLVILDCEGNVLETIKDGKTIFRQK